MCRISIWLGLLQNILSLPVHYLYRYNIWGLKAVAYMAFSESQ